MAVSLDSLCDQICGDDPVEHPHQHRNFIDGLEDRKVPVSVIRNAYASMDDYSI